MIKNRKNRKGFTLIELLVVIAIIAVLAVVVVLTLNPAELLRQARDSNRLSDFATMKSALALYGTDVQTTTLLYAGGGGTYRLYPSDMAATSPASTTLAVYISTSTTGSWGFLGGETAPLTSDHTGRAIDGTGWIPVNFNAISSGAPISSLPVDPTNSGQQTYVFAASSTGIYKLATQMESAKYKNGGTADVQTGDGGNTIYAYEQGTGLQSL
jgi:prepilin-type N-terminal cleavage/methylation domain-containing protein